MYFARRWRHITSHSHANRSIAPSRSLVHHCARDDTVHFQDLGVSNGAALRVLFHETKSREIICYFPARPLRGRRNLPPFFDGTHLFQGQRVTLDCSGRMGVANAGIFLQSGNPGHLHRCRLNPLVQCRHLFHLAKQPGGDRVNGLITHLMSQA